MSSTSTLAANSALPGVAAVYRCTATNLTYIEVTPNLSHSASIRNLVKLKGTGKLTAQDEQVCLKDSKYILFEILENHTWKGRTSS